MKKFLKAIITFIGIITTALGALAIVDKLLNKNRIDGDYLNCSTKNNIEK